LSILFLLYMSSPIHPTSPSHFFGAPLENLSKVRSISPARSMGSLSDNSSEGQTRCHFRSHQLLSLEGRNLEEGEVWLCNGEPTDPPSRDELFNHSFDLPRDSTSSSSSHSPTDDRALLTEPMSPSTSQDMALPNRSNLYLGRPTYNPPSSPTTTLKAVAAMLATSAPPTPDSESAISTPRPNGSTKGKSALGIEFISNDSGSQTPPVAINKPKGSSEGLGDAFTPYNSPTGRNPIFSSIQQALS